MTGVAVSPWVLLGGVLAGLSVAAGALGAHALEPRFEVQYEQRVYEKKRPDGSTAREVPLGQKRLADFQTGAQYQMYHALALIGCGLAASVRSARGWHIAAALFVLGIAGFSGGLYALAVFDQPLLGATVVPLGGILFLAGWLVFALTAWGLRRGLPTP